MPRRALRECSAPGCHALVEKGRCASHARRPWAQKHSRHERGYNSMWVRLRRQVLMEEAYCALCGSPDNPTVDHIIPKSQGGTDDRANLRRLCRLCQQCKASREGNAAKGAA